MILNNWFLLEMPQGIAFLLLFLFFLSLTDFEKKSYKLSPLKSQEFINFLLVFAISDGRFPDL